MAVSLISIHTLAWRVTEVIDCDKYTADISIHTLAWRVTASIVYVHRADVISIHTLAWRVTPRPDLRRGLPVHFNPHPRVEGDDYFK